MRVQHLGLLGFVTSTCSPNIIFGCNSLKIICVSSFLQKMKLSRKVIHKKISFPELQEFGVKYNEMFADNIEQYNERPSA